MTANRVYFGDCRQSMHHLINQGVKVQTCVTSPPYFGLRDYGHDGQIGLENSVDEYVANMVQVFRLVRELLTDDGTLWLNLGDSYSGSGKGRNADGSAYNGFESNAKQSSNQGTIAGNLKANIVPDGLKPKDLIGIPWRVAFALQADGWFLRQDIIWHKTNPMPESVTDRCTKSHEYIFLLSKSKTYFFDHEAIKEPTVTHDANIRDRNKSRLNNTPGRTKSGGLKTNNYEKRNKRSVWTVSTKPYKGAHFAVYPPDLIEPFILAGSRIGDIVLDPFFGSGTTGAVAKKHGRQWIGCEINEEFSPLQQARLESCEVAA